MTRDQLVPAFAAAVLALLAAPTPAPAADPLVFVTAFAPGDKGGIHAYEFDTKDGKLKPLHRTAGVENPFFLALSPDRKFLYSIHAKQFGGKENEQVAAYEVVGRTGELKLLNRQSAEGTAACYLDVDKTGKAVLVANYSSGSVASLPVKADGSLGEPASFFQHKGSSVNPQRQKEPHAHCIVVSPDNRYVFAADLGTDQVLCYKLDPATAKLTPNDPPFAQVARRGRAAAPDVPPERQARLRHQRAAELGHRVRLRRGLRHPDGEADDLDAPEGLQGHQLLRGPEDHAGRAVPLRHQPRARQHRGVPASATTGGCRSIAIEPSLGKGPQNLAITPDGAVAAVREHAGQQRRRVPDRRQDREAEVGRRAGQAAKPVVHHAPAVTRAVLITSRHTPIMGTEPDCGAEDRRWRSRSCSRSTVVRRILLTDWPTGDRIEGTDYHESAWGKPPKSVPQHVPPPLQTGVRPHTETSFR